MSVVPNERFNKKMNRLYRSHMGWCDPILGMIACFLFGFLICFLYVKVRYYPCE